MVSINCSLTINITWTFNGGPLPSNVATLLHGVHSVQVSIWHISKEDEGNYRCTSDEYQHTKYDQVKIVVLQESKK